MTQRSPSEADRVEAMVQLLDGLAQRKDVFEIASAVVDLHPRHNTFPGEVYMGLAVDALELAQVDRDDPIHYESLLDEYLAECEFRGWEKRKIHYAILAGASLRGGIRPDLLNDTAWQTDDYWRYALLACVAVIRAGAVRLGIPVRQFAERLARVHSLDLS